MDEEYTYIHQYTDSQNLTINQLGQLGVKIWPHPLSEGFTTDKLLLLSILSKSIDGEQRLAEIPTRVVSLCQGLELLGLGFVIKNNASAEGKSVYKSNSPETQEQFMKDFNPSSVFFAMEFNSALVDLGKVRVFVTYGNPCFLLHTVNHHWETTGKLDRYDRTSVSAESCENYLNPVDSIQ